MPISLQCPECGRGYRLRDALAGKRVKCGCGAVIAVPGQAAEAAGPPTEHELDEQYDRLPPPAPPRKAAEDKPDAAVRPTGASPRPRRLQDWRKDRWRTTIGVLSIVYGIAMAPLSLAGGVGTHPLDFTKGLLGTFLAATIAFGGVLILRRHRHGPACAGLSCLFLCFFRIWLVVLALLSALATGQLKAFIAILLLSVVLYSIPVFITIWCLRQEVAKRTDSEFPP